METYAPAMEKIFYESQKILEKNNLDILGVHSKFCEKMTFFGLRKKEKKKYLMQKISFFFVGLPNFSLLRNTKSETT
jgi:hypothetical protein